MAAKKGTAHHLAKMTPATVRAARKTYRRAVEGGANIVIDGKRVPVTVNSLARKYGISHQSMRSLLNPQEDWGTWKHVA